MEKKMDRRRILLGAAALTLMPRFSIAAVNCRPHAPGIQACEVGVPIGDFQLAQQQCPNWCWAACIQAVFALRGYGIPQRAIVQKVYGSSVCASAGGPGIVSAVDGDWESSDGRSFQAAAEVLWDTQYFFRRPDAIVQAANELADGHPLILGALGHATVMTGMGYLLAMNGNYQIAQITVRDPWPGHPSRRLLTPQEAWGASFLAKVYVL
jgi:hypothetical protein